MKNIKMETVEENNKQWIEEIKKTNEERRKKMKNYRLDTVENDLIYFTMDSREPAEVVEDCLDAWKDQDFFVDYKIIDKYEEDGTYYFNIIYKQEYYDHQTWEVKEEWDEDYVETWELDELDTYDSFGEYPDYDEIFNVVFKVDDYNEWTNEREDLMIEFLDSMTDEQKIDLAEYFESCSDFVDDDYDGAANLVKDDLIYGYDLYTWSDVLKKFGRLDEDDE